MQVTGPPCHRPSRVKVLPGQSIVSFSRVSKLGVMSQEASHSRAIRRWALILYWITIFLLTHWPEIDRYEPADGWPIPNFSVVMHVVTYGGWVVMWWWLLSVDGRRVTHWACVGLILGGAAYAIFDELSQALVDRHPAVTDFLADMLGVVTAVAICYFWQRSQVYRQIRQEREVSRQLS